MNKPQPIGNNQNQPPCDEIVAWGLIVGTHGMNIV